MYRFRITRQENGGYRFELGGIKLLIEDYQVKDEKHILRNPQKAVAYFNFDDSIYGISNGPTNFDTAEAFYDAMIKQYKMLTDKRPAIAH